MEEWTRVLERAVEATRTGVLITDPSRPDNPIVYVNPAFERITGYSADEVLGRNCRFLQGHDRDQPAPEEARAAIRKGRDCRVSVRNYRKDGALFWQDNPFEGRYETCVDGRTADYTTYKSKPDLIAFLHTEVDPSLEGRGLGSTLVGSALDDARELGSEVLPFCPFVNDFIGRHRDEYGDLVPAGYRPQFGL